MKNPSVRCALLYCILTLATANLFAADRPNGEPAAAAQEKEIEQWSVFEVELHGPADGNPFVNVKLSAEFSLQDQPNARHIQVNGFYDGDGRFRLRFMPDRKGSWQYATSSNVSQLDGRRGSFKVVEPSKANHGPVQVSNIVHFAYADGTPFFPVGTTCYAWIHQTDALQKETLVTLAASPFNKVRMCVFPKWYDHNRKEPSLYPFEGTAPNQWDFTRFNPAFFRHFEESVQALGRLGIEADVILFHPYDQGHWRFDQMPADADDRYLRYVVARLSAYRNVWWSLANEYDLLKAKKESDWDRFFQIVAHDDPYGHLRSIHNCQLIYNHTNPLVTHASIQDGAAVEDVGRAEILRDVYRKPIVYDEVKYEGNLPARWGNLSAEELVFRFWNATIGGTYATHGETYQSPSDEIWWSHGGQLHGKSPQRIAFLKKIVETAPGGDIDPMDPWQDMRTAGKKGEYYLIYFGKETPTDWPIELPAAGLKVPMDFHIDLIDTWNMEIKPLDGTFHCVPKPEKYRYACQNVPTITLPGKPYVALRFTRVQNSGSSQ
jgi:Domain of unknown function (DUF5060)/Protein of unknown function (DUF4038)/Domain of unknown function (DUF5605)